MYFRLFSDILSAPLPAWQAPAGQRLPGLDFPAGGGHELCFIIRMYPARSTIPPVTKFLLASNIGVFLFGGVLLPLLGGRGAGEAFYYTFGLLPGDFWRGALWQLFTSMFLHGSFLHILMNMVALWSLGMLLEQAVGSRAFAYLYGIAGLAGGLFVAVFQSSLNIPTVGASGAISGMLGAIALLFPESRLLLFVFPVRARTAAILFGAVSLVFSLVGDGSNISHLGHLGGLLGGLAFTYLALRRPQGGQAFDFDRGGPAGFADGFGRPFERNFEQPFGRPQRSGPARTTYYDPVRGVFFTVDADHPAAGSPGRPFDARQIDAMRRIQAILKGRTRPAANEGDGGDGPVRFFRPGPRY